MSNVGQAEKPAGTRGFSLGSRVPPPSGEYRWVYLWQWPIRAMHWIAAVTIVALVITGFYIGKPYFVRGTAEAPFLVTSWMRLIHFIAAGALVMTGIVRIYWLFAGNRYERLPALFPVRRKDWFNLFQMIRYYLMIHPQRGPHYLGHNPLQQFAYTGVYVVVLIMVITGFTLYGQSNPGGAIDRLFGWTAVLVGGMPIVRFIHHVMTWALLIFLPIHIYLAIRADRLEGTASISSIVSGGRFVPKDQEYIDG
jgi:Ni/Fe-hydrogenase 1 B-type cytochrome subunit